MARHEVAKRGGEVRHFTVTTVDGARVNYTTDLWQHKNLVFVSIDAEDPVWRSYAQQLLPRSGDFRAAETALVITADSVDGLPSPGVAVADRWGEIVQVFTEGNTTGAPRPSADDLLEWVTFVRIQCPECPP